MVYRLWLIFLLLVSIDASASFMGTFMGSYLTDTSTPSSSNSYSDNKQLLGASVMASMDSKDSFYLGFSYTQLTDAASQNSTSQSFSTVDMGPCFLWFPGKNKQINLAGAYNVTSKASYSQTGQTGLQWSGTSYWMSAGADMEFAKSIQLGLHIIYYEATYNSQTAGSVASTVSASRGIVMPMITLTYRKGGGE